MRIAVIGAGSVGRALAGAFERTGHDVVVGVRDPDGAKHAGLTHERATPRAATAGAAVVVLAVPAPALAEAIPALGLAAGTVVLDATNAVGAPPPGGHATVGDLVASLVPEGVAVAKAFDTIGAEHLATGTVDGVPALLPVAGDEAATAVALELGAAIGFDAVVVGGREAFAMVEQHAALWIELMRRGWGRDFGFSVIGSPRRGEP
ncbi:MAG: NAD(P)-binding domain-containing protein [Acidimicrobiales bacterium]